ncbi:GntR family transcriptional regulator [Rhodophyticola sp. CCM32]|uniref:GntR family transcriptional regulator n=1 Tax=Rhodophyticola sp. CCM32 TaxID=2916397 RepID=UPI00107EF39C|nr:GntR family transcriptional regulator [Rhodophyticola sp. CCM32]QBY01345.1 GntR family transcriptional regulator [Rhodophyticola sp. CCM32]
MLKETDKRLALQAYEKVLDLILSGEAQPGDLLNERRLAEHLDMSRTPVRDALLMLEGEGLLVRQGKRGLQIKQMRIEDYMDALQIRTFLEPEVARMAAMDLEEGALDDLAATLKQLVERAATGQARIERDEVRGVDEQLHGLIADAAGNQQLSSIIRMLRRQTQIFDLKRLPERLEDTCREHLAIIDALNSRRGDDAAAAMRTHLDKVRASIVARLVKS